MCVLGGAGGGQQKGGREIMGMCVGVGTLEGMGHVHVCIYL